MANKYIVLKTLDGTTINKKFRVISGGYNERFLKPGALTRTITGDIDMKAGKILEVLECIVRVRHTEESGSDYGTRQDLIDLFKLNDPTDPNAPDLLTLIDHYGNEKQAYLHSEMIGNPLSTIIEGTQAWFIYQLTLLIKPQ